MWPTRLGYTAPDRARAGVADVAHRVRAAHSSSPPNCAGHARRQGHRCEPDARGAARGAVCLPRHVAHAAPRAGTTATPAGPSRRALAAARARRGCAPGSWRASCCGGSSARSAAGEHNSDPRDPAGQRHRRRRARPSPPRAPGSPRRRSRRRARPRRDGGSYCDGGSYISVKRLQ
jgi:hypothetical protein